MNHNISETNGGLREGSYAVDRHATTHLTADGEWPEDERVPVVVVLEFHPLPASAVYIDALDQTVAEANPDYSPRADVARVAYVDSLDAYCGSGWTAWAAEEFGARLTAYRDEWGINVPTYDFPAPRLRDIGRVGAWSPDDAHDRAIAHLQWLAEQEADDE